MRVACVVPFALLLATMVSRAAPAQAPSAGPTFEVVSVKRNTTGALGSSSMSQRPNGGMSLINLPVTTLISQAYPSLPADMIGLPDWTANERYDVVATASLPVPPQIDDRRAMMRAMLAHRFKLVAHYEKREQPTFDLVVARSDGRLGPGLMPSEVDCGARAAAGRAAGGPPSPPVPLPREGASPPCTLRMSGNVMTGDMTMASLVTFLRPAAGRHVVDKTGLTGFYRVTIQYDPVALIRPPSAAAPADESLSVFTAVQEQLGLKLEPSRSLLDVLVIDNIERPTEN